MNQKHTRCRTCGSTISTASPRCAHCGTPAAIDGEEEDTFATRLERAVGLGDLPSRGPETAKVVEDPANAVPRWRPSERPPLALVCVVDDGRDQGEWVRLRQPQWIVGRTEGDFIVGHDSAISGKHFRIYRTDREGAVRWRLEDLDSRNGTFVRCAESLMPHAGQVILGKTRLRFELAQQARAQAEHPVATRQLLRPGVEAQARLVRVGVDGQEEPIPLAAASTWIGSDPGPGGIELVNDPFVSPRHAKIVRRQDGSWRVVDHQSRNGTWIAVQEISLGSSAEILAGEQRFIFRVM